MAPTILRYFIASALLLVGSIATGAYASGIPPSLTSPAHANETATTAVLGGTITGSGDSAVVACGVVSALSSDSTSPIIGLATVTNTIYAGTCAGFFSLTVTGLTTGQMYSFRPYATNGAGTEYTVDAGTFTTPWAAASPPALLNPAASNVTSTTALLAAQHLAIAGSPDFTEHGIVYAPTAQNVDPIINGPGVIKVPVAGNMAGYSALVGNLQPSTTYSFKGYATNSVGTGYTGVRTFTTAAQPPTVISPTHTNVTASGATLGGNVTSAGSAPITERGVVYMVSQPGCNPTIGASGVIKASDASVGLGIFTVTLPA